MFSTSWRSCRPASNRGLACFVFFNLYRRLPAHCLADLNRVKALLEREIEVVATDDAANVMEAFPCRIQETELEDFCRRMMDETVSLLKPGMSQLTLAFRFCPLRERQSA